MSVFIKEKGEGAYSLKKYYLFIVLVLLLYLLGACVPQNVEESIEAEKEATGMALEGETEDENSIESANLNYKERTLRLGVIHYPPYVVVEGDEIRGPYVTLVSEAFERLGYSYSIETYPWSRILTMVESGELDGVIDVFDNNQRRSYIYYPEQPIGLYSQGFLVMRDSNIRFDGNLDSIKDFKIGVVQDYSYGNKFDKAVANEELKVDLSHDGDANIEKLLQGRLQIIVNEMGHTTNYVQKHDLMDRIEMLEPVMTNTYSYVGFSKANALSQLRAEVDGTLKDMIGDGTFYKIFDQYDLTDYGMRFKAYQESYPPQHKYFQHDEDAPIAISLIEDTPPYVFKQDGEYKGLIVDIVNEAFTRMGMRYKMEGVPFNRAITQLQEGSLDVGTDVFRKPEREAFLYYPIEYPIAVYPYTLFKLKTLDFEFTGNPEELIPYKIGYIRGYSLGGYDQYVNDDRFTFVESESPEANMKLLLNGRVDFVVDVMSTGVSVIENHGAEDEVELVLPAINSNASYITFSKARNLEKLMYEYEYVVQSMIDDGTLQAIYDSYELDNPLKTADNE